MGLFFDTSPTPAGQTVSLTISMEQGVEPPGTEYSYDRNWLTTDTIISLANVKSPQIASIDTAVMPYVRFKVVGGSSNGNTKIKMKVVR